MSDDQIISSASADALKVEVPPTPIDTQKQKQIEPPAKKPRFDKNKGKRHGGVSYTKDTTKTSLSMVTRRKYYPIFTSNIGCQFLSDYTFRVIQGRDFRLANAITQLQLEYVLTVAYCNRVVQVSIMHGYAFPLNASRLKQVATGIQLPNVLCQYIESLGVVDLASTASVVPLAADYHQLFPENTRLMRDPAVILQEAERPVPEGDWALDLEWIVDYNDATTRASRSGMKFRVVDNSDYRGRFEMFVSYEGVRDHGLLLPIAPQVITEAEGQLGAAYRFRDYQQQAEWFGENHDLLFNAFVGIPFDPMIVFSDICVAAFKGATVSNE